MSSNKRGASEYITKNGEHNMSEPDDSQPARQATAAQLANRRIAQARGRSGVRHRPSPQPSSFSSSGLGATSQSFPPVNGTSSLGNGSANASFGGFGSSSSGFSFNAGGSAVNNPFAQSAEQPATNGATGTGMSFNFGGQQASSAPVAFGQGIFSGGAAQSQPQSQPSTAFGGFSATAQPQASSPFAFGSQTSNTTNMFGATAQPASQPASGGFGGFGASTSTPATTTSSVFSGFGSTAGQPQQSTFSGFGQPATQSAQATEPAAAPTFSAFGQSAPAFGQTNGDAMQSSPDPSPQKPAWNKQASNGALDTASGKPDSPDRPPHVEQSGDESRPNVFAGLTRPPPQPVFTPKPTETKPASTPLFSFSKPVGSEQPKEPEKQPEKAKESAPSNLFTPAKASTTSAPSNPFASLQRMPESQQPSLFSTPSQAAKPQDSVQFFNSTPQAALPAKSLFNPSTSLFSAQKPAEETSSNEAPLQKSSGVFQNFSSPATTPVWGKKPTEATSAPSNNISTITQPPPAPYVSSNSTVVSQLLPEVMREDNLLAPDPQLGLSSEDTKHWYQALKVARLNKAIVNLLARSPSDADLSPLMADYMVMIEKIKATTAGTRLNDLTSAHGDAEGQRRYDQEQGRLPLDGTNKRKAPPAEDQEKEKRAKPNEEGGQSSTASKFQSIFEQSGSKSNAAPAASNVFGASIASPTPMKTSNLFAQTAASSTPATNLFSASTESSNKPATGNIFGKTSATPSQSNASNLFAKETSTTTTSPAPTFPAFKPSTSLNITGTNTSSASASPGTPAFTGFKPVSNSSSSTSTLPKFGSGSTNFLSQFSKSAEDEAKKAKQRAFEDDYDSDEETKEQWEARYEKQLEEKKKQVSAASSVGGFKFTPTSSVAGSNAGSGDESEPKKTSSFLAPPGTSSVFNLSRSPSPANAASPDGSVFDLPRSSTPGNLSKDNPFAHLSRQPSEKGDADDEQESADGDDHSLAGATDGQNEHDDDNESTPKAPNSTIRRGPFEEDSEESQPETPKPRTDGLFGRISRDASGDRTPLASTGANQGSLFSTSGPASQVWTPKDPIKFAPTSTAKDGEKTTSKPLFDFTPAAGSQPVLSGLFSGTKGSTPAFGAFTPTNKPASTSSLFPPSGAASVLSTPGWGSRATTPGVSDLSGAESTAGEAEEARPDAQIDIADMAKDKKGHEVIFESIKVKATKYNKGDKDSDDAAAKEGWQVVGVGPLAVLKNDESGVVSMLMRAVPSGKIIINTRMGSVLNTQVMNKRARFNMVTGDGPVSYLISFQSADDCKAFVDACKANGAT